MVDPSELRERLEKAEGPSRELDAAIACHFGWKRREMLCLNINGATECAVVWLWPGISEESIIEIEDEVRNQVAANLWRYDYDEPPRFTSSLDAAVALVERVLPSTFGGVASSGWEIGIYRLSEPGKWNARLQGGWKHNINSEANTPALALCIALTRAMEADDDRG